MSQNINDTICIPAGQLRKIIKDNENGKLARKELEITRNSLDTAKLALSIKDTIITGMKQKDTIRISQLSNYEAAINLLKEQNLKIEEQFKVLNTERLKEKRGKILFRITTVIAILTAGYFAIIK